MRLRCANHLFGNNPDCPKFFSAKPSSKQECCSRKCSVEFKRRERKRRILIKETVKRHKGL